MRESDAPIVIGPVEAGPVVPALGLLLPPLLHAARTPAHSATAPMAMAFLENQGRLDLNARFLLPRCSGFCGAGPVEDIGAL